VTPSRARVWAWRVAALLPAWVVATFLADGRVPVPVRFEVAVVLVATLLRPAIGLALVAFVAPLGDMVAPLLGGLPPLHADALVVAFLAAWMSAYAGKDADALPSGLGSAMGLFGAAAIASLAATALQLHHEDWFALYQTRVALAHDYLFTNDFIGAHAAGALLEGLGLAASACALARRDDGDRLVIALALAASGIVAAVGGVLLAFGVAPAATMARHLVVGLLRYSAVSSDVNATASLYLLVLGVSAGVAWSVRGGRVAWIAAAGVIVYALTLTGSIAAIMTGALAAAVALAWWIARVGSRVVKAGAIVAAAVAIAAAILYLRTPRAESSLEMRGGFTKASVRMIETRPLVGVGVGRYYPLSRLVLPPSLAWSYGLENAHDYYLQIAAELGLVGLAAFVWLLAGALGPAVGRALRGRADALTIGGAAGLVMYLVTAVAGQPFLVPEAAAPFWIVLGLVAAPRAASRRGASAWPARIALAAAAVLLATLPLRRDAGPALRLSAGEDGLGIPLLDRDGGSFRESAGFASLFAPPSMTAIDVPVRLSRRVHAGAAIVSVKVPGGYAAEARVGHAWFVLHIPLPGPEPLLPRERINVAAFPLPEFPPEPIWFDVGNVRPTTDR
jgi:O-antigen ligase